MSEKKYQYEQMQPDEFLAAVKKLPVFFVPIGLLEWHGDHLPLGLDGLKAHGLCIETARKLNGGIVLPPNYIGRPGYSRYTGTLTYSEALVNLMLTETFEQLQKIGAKVVVVITGHYGPLQVDCVKRAAECYAAEHPELIIIAQAEYEGVTVDGQAPADHAGKWETSMLSYFYPQLCDMDKFNMNVAPMSIYKNPPNDYYKESDEWKWQEDLRLAASPELGAKCAGEISRYLAKRVKTALLSLE